MNKSYSIIKLKFDRLLSKSLWRQFAILCIIFILIFFLSWLFLYLSGCKLAEFCEENNLETWHLPFYLLTNSNAYDYLYTHSINRWALFVSRIISIGGMFIFSGLFMFVITNAIEQRANKYQEGHIFYPISDHYIIMGYDDMVSSIILHLFEKNADAFVLLMGTVEVPFIKEKLKRIFTEEQLGHIIINYGHRISSTYYKDIHLDLAEEIFIVGQRSHPAHDAINVECVDNICNYLRQAEITKRPKRITCVFEDLDTYAAFKTSEIFGGVRSLGIEFEPYNFYSGWAKQVFLKRYYKDIGNKGYLICYPAVYGEGLSPDDSKYVHLVFIGMTYFSVVFAMEAANLFHFPNSHQKGAKTRITFIDINADKEKNVFIVRNRHFFEIQEYTYYDLSDEQEEKKQQQGVRKEYLSFTGENANFLDIEFEFIKGDIFSKKVQDEIAKWSGEHNKKQYLSIFFAMADQRQNFVMGMNMPDEVYSNEIPVFIRQDRSDNFVSNLRTTDEAIKTDKRKKTYVKIEEGEVKAKTLGGRYANIYPFGMNETAYSADEKSLKRAKLINYLYCTANYSNNMFTDVLELDAMSIDQIWKDANMFWNGLSVALKWSNLYCAYTIRTKLATLRVMRGLNIEDSSCDAWPLSEKEVEEMARVEHNRWNVEKLLMGYRKPHRDEDKYVHPEFANHLAQNKRLFIQHDIRPFDQLGSIIELDYEFSRYIPWIVRMTEN